MKSLILAAVFLPLSIVGVLAQSNLQRSVFFDKDKSELKPQGEANLLEVLDFLNKNPTFQILLKGFTDADGSDEHNKALAVRRVQTVHKFLEQKGVNTAKMTTLALGKAQPIADNATEEGKKQNRRVDINVTFVQSTPSVNVPSKGKTENLFGLYRELATPIQTFKINTAKDTVIRGAKGTVLVIPKNAFAGAPNGAVVDLKLKEAYSFSDIIRDNLNTMSDDKMLQTGGMIYTEANYKGEKLGLQQNLQVQFNSKESQLDGMQLFSGERNMQKNGEMNWTPLSKTEEKEEITTIYANTGEAFRPYLILNEKTNKPITIKELCDTIGCYPLLINENTVSGFSVRPNMSNTCGAMAMFLNDRPNLPRNMPLEKVHQATYAEAYQMYGVNTFSELKNQDGRKWDSLMVERMNLALYDQSPAYIARKKRNDSLRAINVERERIQDSVFTEKINKNPAFKLSKMGWINIDRFPDFNEKEMATIKINLLRKEDCDIKIISKKWKSAIGSSRYENNVSEFKTFKNEDIVLVAMKIENGESFLSIMEMKGQNIELTPNFKALSPDQIKEKLKILDN